MRSANGWTLGASTLGVVGEDLDTTVTVLRRHGATAVELRSADGAYVHTRLPAQERSAVRAAFTDVGIEVTAVASRVQIAAPGDDDAVVAALVAELELAADVGATFVRVFPGAGITGSHLPSDQVPQLDEDTAQVDARAVHRFRRVLDTAARLGVRPVLETHDSHPRGEDVARVLAALDDAAPGHLVGAVWDVLHPWRVGEPLERSAAHLLRYVVGGRGYVQVKDVAHPADTTPVLQGAGSVPTDRFLALLDEGGYRGPVSLEWERFWYPDVPPLDDALGAAARALQEHPPRR